VWCVAGVLRVFCSISTKHPKNIEKHWKHKKLTIRSCIAGVFQKSQNFRLYCVLHKTPFTKHLQNTAKQNCYFQKTLAKQSQNVFCEITSQNTTKQTRNAQKRHKTLAIQPQHVFVLHAFGVFFPNTLDLDLSQKYAIRNTRT